MVTTATLLLRADRQTGHVDAFHYGIHPTPTTRGFLDAVQIREFAGPQEIGITHFFGPTGNL
jgi:hypothetical protein